MKLLQVGSWETDDYSPLLKSSNIEYQTSFVTKDCKVFVKNKEQDYSETWADLPTATKQCVMWESITFWDLGAQFCVCFGDMECRLCFIAICSALWLLRCLICAVRAKKRAKPSLLASAALEATLIIVNGSKRGEKKHSRVRRNKFI